MHIDLGSIVSVLALGLGAWLGHRITKPKDHERALALDSIARGAAALAVSLYPDAKWADLFKRVVEIIASAAGVPTHNKDAIERAAAAALAATGKAPGA